MGLPDTQVFQTFLSSLTITAPQEEAGHESVMAIPPVKASFPNGMVLERPGINLWYAKTNLSLKSLECRIEEELLQRGHKTSSGIILSLLSVFALLPGRRENPVSNLNRIFDQVSSGDLSQYQILPASKPPDYSLKFGSFTIDNLNWQVLKYRCNKAHSDYFELYGDKLIGRFAIERDFIKVKVIDWKPFIRELRDECVDDFSQEGPLYQFILSYFEQLSWVFFDDFKDSMLEKQHLLIAAGAPYIDEKVLSLIPGSDKISVYLNVGKDKFGYVVPVQTHQTIELGGSDVKMRKTKEYLKETFNIDEDTHLNPTLKIFAFFLSKAKRHNWDNRLDESFLHYIIALDLLFGEKNLITEAIGNRVAICVFNKMNKDGYYKKFGTPKMDFPSQKKRIQKLYEARSQYVHSGEHVKEELGEEAEVICVEILYCLLRLHVQNPTLKNHQEQIGKWLEKLDYLAASEIAGEDQSKEKYLEFGIYYD